VNRRGFLKAATGAVVSMAVPAVPAVATPLPIIDTLTELLSTACVIDNHFTDAMRYYVMTVDKDGYVGGFGLREWQVQINKEEYERNSIRQMDGLCIK
jgi:hypothetical protein